MSAYPMPDQEGHYWAKLEAHAERDLLSPDWEVVFVFDNIMRPWCEADIVGGECQMVSVPGIAGGQPLGAFAWGPRVLRPPELDAHHPPPGFENWGRT